jgi:tartrate-resistant acid phosphatase type 5
MQEIRGILALALALGVSCADDGRDTDDTNADDTSAAQSSGEETGEPGDPGRRLRFVAVGDAGAGNDDQYAVGAMMEQVCAQRGCEFALYLGDNFYEIGVESALDEQFSTKFEQPYMDLDFPFYVVLGNHDYGSLGNNFEQGQYQIDYAASSDKFVLPNEFHSFEIKHAKFYGIDTSRLVEGLDVDSQREFVQNERANASDDIEWHIIFGHHPYISNGFWGNAGNYAGVDMAGQHVKELFDDEVCGNFSVYFSGHDHGREWLQPTCGTEFIVSGAGSKLRPFVRRDDNPVHWGDDQQTGFAWVEIDDKTMTVAFYDRDGTLDYESQFEIP